MKLWKGLSLGTICVSVDSNTGIFLSVGRRNVKVLWGEWDLWKCQHCGRSLPRHYPTPESFIHACQILYRVRYCPSKYSTSRFTSRHNVSCQILCRVRYCPSKYSTNRFTSRHTVLCQILCRVRYCPSKYSTSRFTNRPSSCCIGGNAIL